MNRLNRWLFLGLGGFLLFLAMSIAIQRWIVFPQFETLQKESLRIDETRLRNALDREEASLAAFLADYAEWDDTCDFIQSGSEEYLASNFTPSSFATAPFKAIWIIGPDGVPRFSARYDAESQALKPIAPEAGTPLTEGHPFLRPLDGQTFSSIVITPEGPLMVVAQPVLTSEAEGPPQGVMVMARPVDSTFATALSDQVQHPVQIELLTTSAANETPTQLTRRMRSDGMFESSLSQHDMFGEPALRITMTTPSYISALGRQALTQSVMAILAMGLVFLVAGILLTHRALRKSQRMELSKLLNERTTALRETEQYLQSIMDAVPAGIVIVDAEAHTILDANPAALALMNRQRQDVLGHVCHKFMCPAEEGRCPITDLEKSCDRAERQVIRVDGSSIPVLKTVIPVELRQHACLLECFVDIRDRKQMEEQLRQTVEEMGRMNRAMLGRENRILELKREVNQLLEQAGQTPRYGTSTHDTSSGDFAS